MIQSPGDSFTPYSMRSIGLKADLLHYLYAWSFVPTSWVSSFSCYCSGLSEEKEKKKVKSLNYRVEYTKFKNYFKPCAFIVPSNGKVSYWYFYLFFFFLNTIPVLWKREDIVSSSIMLYFWCLKKRIIIILCFTCFSKIFLIEIYLMSWLF